MTVPNMMIRVVRFLICVLKVSCLNLGERQIICNEVLHAVALYLQVKFAGMSELYHGLFM